MMMVRIFPQHRIFEALQGHLGGVDVGLYARLEFVVWNPVAPPLAACSALRIVASVEALVAEDVTAGHEDVRRPFRHHHHLHATRTPVRLDLLVAGLRLGVDVDRAFVIDRPAIVRASGPVLQRGPVRREGHRHCRVTRDA